MQIFVFTKSGNLVRVTGKPFTIEISKGIRVEIVEVEKLLDQKKMLCGVKGLQRLESFDKETQREILDFVNRYRKMAQFGAVNPEEEAV